MLSGDPRVGLTRDISMANRNFASGGKIYSMHVMPVLLDCNVAIGASGAPGTLKGPGIASITRLSAGIYQVQLQDNYNRYYFGAASFVSPVSGTPVADGSFSTGTVYVITSLGTTNWAAAGLPANIAPAVGAVFKAANAGGAGSGTAETSSHSGIFSTEAIGDTNTMLSLFPTTPLLGGLVTFQTLNASGAATDPASGSVMALTFYLSNSSIQVQGE